jgi:hypothetical protein
MAHRKIKRRSREVRQPSILSRQQGAAPSHRKHPGYTLAATAASAHPCGLVTQLHPPLRSLRTELRAREYPACALRQQRWPARHGGYRADSRQDQSDAPTALCPESPVGACRGERWKLREDGTGCPSQAENPCCSTATGSRGCSTCYRQSVDHGCCCVAVHAKVHQPPARVDAHGERQGKRKGRREEQVGRRGWMYGTARWS